MSTSPPAKSRWNRRTVTLASRPAAPLVNSSDTVSSFKRIDTSPNIQVPHSPWPPRRLAPSPIVESLLHEAAASLEDHVPTGPSPLAQSTMDSGAVHKTPTPIDIYIPPPRNGSDPFAATKPAGSSVWPIDIPRPAAPSFSTAHRPIVPSPISEMLAREVGSKKGGSLAWYTSPLGAFNEELEELPRRAVAIDPPVEYPARRTVFVAGFSPVEYIPSPVIDSSADVLGASTEKLAELPQQVMGVGPAVEGSPSLPMAQRPETEFYPKRVAKRKAKHESVHENEASHRHKTIREHEVSRRSVREAPGGDVRSSEREAAREPAMEGHAPIDPSPLAQGTAINDAMPCIPPALSSSAAAGLETFTDKAEDPPQPIATTEAVAIPNNGDAGGRSRTPRIHTPHKDPFAVPIGPEPNPDIFDPYEQVGGMSRDGNDDHIPILMPAPDITGGVGHPSLRSIQEATPAQSIQGFDTDETRPLIPRSSPPNISYLQPPTHPDHVTISPSDGVPMDCGMMPSRIYPPGQGPSRHRISPHQGPEQGKVGSEDVRTRVEWVIPFSRDSRSSDAQKQILSGSPDEVYNVTHDFETREVSYVSPPSPSSRYDWHVQSPANPHCTVSLSAKPLLPQDDRPFHAHGWTEYLLPDESVYYVHQTYQVVADVDLSDERLLDIVMAYLENHGDVLSPGQEFWLQDVGPRGGGFVPLRCLIDHTKQSVMFDPSREADGDCERHRIHHGCRDDRLDVKYRYWSFMESHPAHTSLPSGAHQDAMDALSWASTDGLLPSHRSAPAPFTQEECQSLTALLQSIHTRGETPLRTHTVSKILLRVVCWRQSHFRPDKPLPADAGRDFDGLHRRDHSMLIRRNVLVLMVGLYACLATAIALCPAPTFARTVGIGAILLLLFPVVVLAVAWSKVDNGPVAPHVRRDVFVSPLKNWHTITGSARPPWHTRLWQGSESRLHRSLVSGPSNTFPTTVADFV